jgi:hypothetical protein
LGGHCWLAWEILIWSGVLFVVVCSSLSTFFSLLRLQVLEGLVAMRRTCKKNSCLLWLTLEICCWIHSFIHWFFHSLLPSLSCFGLSLCLVVFLSQIFSVSAHSIVNSSGKHTSANLTLTLSTFLYRSHTCSIISSR